MPTRDHQRERQQAIWLFGWLCAMLCAACLVASCGVGTSLPPLPDLHIPGVSKVGSITQLQTDSHGRRISGLTTYIPPGATASPHVLVQLASGIYDAALVGDAQVHKLPLTLVCLQSLVVTRDGQEGACQTTTGIGVFALGDPALETGQELLHNPLDPAGIALSRFVYPAWSPDGTYLAAIRRDGEQQYTYTLAIYRMASSVPAVHLVALLPLMGLDDEAAALFSLGNLVWSPSGKQMAFVAGVPDSTHIYVLQLADVLTSVRAGGPPPTIPVQPSMLPARAVNGGSALSWSPDSQVLTYVAPGQQHIMQINLTTQAQAVLVQESVATLCDATWTPDGHYLLFVLCQPSSDPEVTPPPDQLYMYSSQDM